MLNIVLISGSIRAESANTAVLRAAADYLAGADAASGREPVSVTRAAIDDLPAYNEDVEEVGWPHPVQRLRDIVADADAILVSTPEYNGSMPGVLKNALDWMSRPHGDGVLQGKVAATISASPSPYGAQWAQEHLRAVLEACKVTLVNPEPVTLANAFDALDAHGEVTAPDALVAIRRLTDQVLARSRQLTRQ